MSVCVLANVCLIVRRISVLAQGDEGLEHGRTLTLDCAIAGGMAL